MPDGFLLIPLSSSCDRFLCSHFFPCSSFPLPVPSSHHTAPRLQCKALRSPYHHWSGLASKKTTALMRVQCVAVALASPQQWSCQRLCDALAAQQLCCQEKRFAVAVSKAVSKSVTLFETKNHTTSKLACSRVSKSWWEGEEEINMSIVFKLPRWLRVFCAKICLRKNALLQMFYTSKFLHHK